MTTTEFSTMMKHALNAAAPDNESWDAGYKKFKSSIADGETVEQSYYNGLDAAAPTQELWIEGYNQLVLWGALEGATTEHTAPTRTSLKSKFKENKLAIRKLFNKDIDHEPKPWVVFFWGIVIYAFFGMLAGALIMAILGLTGLIGRGVGDVLMPIFLIATILIGAFLGYASAAKQLRRRAEKKHAHTVPVPIPETA